MEQTNPYQTPEAELLTETPTSNVEVPFYIVGEKKAWLLFVATFGLYQVYWFYKHWVYIKEQEGSSIWPAPRAIFSYFFCHSLFRKISSNHEKSGRLSTWNPNASATVYIICTLVSNGTDRIADKLESYSAVAVILIGIVALIASISTMISAQTHINDLAKDAHLELNTSLSWANYIWIALGSVLWILSIAGIIATVNPALFDF